jgi:hypothetical protein
MKISNIGRAEHRLLSSEIQAAVADIATKYGVKLTVGGGNLGTNEGMIKIQVALEVTASGKSAAEEKFARYCHYFGMEPDHYGTTVRIQNAFFKIVGLNPSAPKNSIELERVSDGKNFKCPLSTVKSQLPMKKAA